MTSSSSNVIDAKCFPQYEKNYSGGEGTEAVDMLKEAEWTL